MSVPEVPGEMDLSTPLADEVEAWLTAGGPEVAEHILWLQFRDEHRTHEQGGSR